MVGQEGVAAVKVRGVRHDGRESDESGGMAAGVGESQFFLLKR